MADDGGIFFEVDFRLDANGRTALNNNDDEAGAADTSKTTKAPLDYSTKVCWTKLERASPPCVPTTTTAAEIAAEDPTTTSSAAGPAAAAVHDDTIDEQTQLFQELLFDCEIADSGLMPRTYWLAATDPPRCTLEQFAHDIFLHHTAALVRRSSSSSSSLSFDLARSGAEWWVQIRPSPEKTGKYAMHGDKTDPNEEQGVCFHWDKDEELRTICGGNTYVHPHWSTVTYLTGAGAPTLILEGCRVDNLTGEWKDDGDGTKKRAVVSWPDQWKHLSFDGRWLHAVPGDLATRPATPDQRRYTFLVNVWLNHIPCDTHRFPASLLDKLSGHAGTAKASCRTRLCLRFGGEDEDQVLAVPSILLNQLPGDNNSAPSVSPRTWPMGDPGETVTVLLPNNISSDETTTCTSTTTHAYHWPAGVDGIVLQRQQPATDDRLSKRPRTALAADESSDLPSHG